MKDKTICAKIIDREIPASIVYEDDQCLAFNDVHPQAPVHVLIVPKKPIDRLSSASGEDQLLLGHLLLTANKIAEQAGLKDFRLVVNSGPGAGQTVLHLHVHILGGREMEWPPG